MTPMTGATGLALVVPRFFLFTILPLSFLLFSPQALDVLDGGAPLKTTVPTTVMANDVGGAEGDGGCGGVGPRTSAGPGEADLITPPSLGPSTVVQYRLAAASAVVAGLSLLCIVWTVFGCAVSLLLGCGLTLDCLAGP